MHLKHLCSVILVLLTSLALGCTSPGKYPQYGKSNSAAEQFIDFSFRNQANYAHCSAAIALPGGYCNNCNVDAYMASYPIPYSVSFACGQTVEQSNRNALNACAQSGSLCASAWIRNNTTGVIGSYRDNVSSQLAEGVRIQMQQQQQAAKTKLEEEDTRLCQKYGFKMGTSDFASCRLQISLARDQMSKLAAIATQQQIQNAQIQAAQKAAANAAESQALFELSSRMLSGQGAFEALSGIGSGQTFVPTPSRSDTQTFRLPNGSIFSCTQLGSYVSCH